MSFSQPELVRIILSDSRLFEAVNWAKDMMLDTRCIEDVKMRRTAEALNIELWSAAELVRTVAGKTMDEISEIFSSGKITADIDGILDSVRIDDAYGNVGLHMDISLCRLNNMIMVVQTKGDKEHGIVMDDESLQIVQVKKDQIREIVLRVEKDKAIIGLDDYEANITAEGVVFFTKRTDVSSKGKKAPKIKPCLSKEESEETRDKIYDTMKQIKKNDRWEKKGRTTATQALIR